MIAIELARDRADRGESTAEDGYFETCPPGTTAALGVLRRELAALAEDYDEQTRDIGEAIGHVDYWFGMYEAAKEDLAFERYRLRSALEYIERLEKK